MHVNVLLTMVGCAVAWASTIVDTSSAMAVQSVTLEVDFDWLVQAKAVGPFVAKDVFLQEINTFVPVAEVTSGLAVAYSAHDHAILNATVSRLMATHTGEVTHKVG